MAARRCRPLRLVPNGGAAAAGGVRVAPGVWLPHFYLGDCRPGVGGARRHLSRGAADAVEDGARLRGAGDVAVCGRGVRARPVVAVQRARAAARERRGLTLEEIERVSEKRWARSPSPTGDKVEDTDESVAETVCSICLSELALLAEAAVPDVVEDAVGRAGIDMVRQLRRCGHLFHVNCIDPWLATDCTCPLCKQAVDEASSHGSEAQ
eukprot:ctg_1010.g333